MTPFELFEELIRYRQVAQKDTASLAKYSHDDLCNKITDQIELMLGAFEKYKNISYMVQGPRDNGVDVLLKIEDEENGGEQYIGLQIKSSAEIADRNNGLSKDLKAGLHDANNHYNSLSRYYIILGGDSKADGKRISAITTEFAKRNDVRVINPRYLRTFIDMPFSTIATVVDHHLSEEDYVHKRAHSELSHYSAIERKFILTCICWSIENGTEIIPDEVFRDDPIMSEIGLSYIAECLGSLDDTDFETHADETGRRFRREHFEAVSALYYDFKVRYDESEEDLRAHLLEFFSWGLEDDDGDQD